MDYVVWAVIAVVGVAIGVYFSRLRSGQVGRRGRAESLIDTQAAEKVQNKAKIMQFVRERGQIQNNDVEKVAGVSNATAERYLNELEKEGKLTQHGTIGQNVHYTLK